MKELLWGACYIYITPKTKVPMLARGLSLPFDQQVTLSPKNLSPNFRWGCLCLLISKQHWIQKTHPNISCGGVSTLAENTCSFQVSPPWQRHLVLMRCYLLTIQVDMKELLWEVCYICITPKNQSSNFGWGVVSVFWSASDTESKKPTS